MQDAVKSTQSAAAEAAAAPAPAAPRTSAQVCCNPRVDAVNARLKYLVMVLFDAFLRRSLPKLQQSALPTNLPLN
jgi:3-oxoacyl-ACP reductase-like protein